MSPSAESSSDDARGRGQQPMLARNREKKEAPSNNSNWSSYFPLGLKEGASQWWASVSPAAAEHRVLSYVPYLKAPPTQLHTATAPVNAASANNGTVDSDPAKSAEPVRTTSKTDPYGPRLWHSNLVQLSGKNRAINEFSVERIDEDVEENLVMLHGYGAGLGFFYNNFEGLSRVKGWKLYALDMLGMGRSSRPPFRISAKDKQGKITEAENWFIDAVEEWRILKKIDKFTLLGHSMGGYMATAYALKYPGRLNKLILASPVGIPEDPNAVNDDMPKPEESTMMNEFTQDGENDIVNNGRDKSANSAKSTSSKKKDPPKRNMPKWAVYLWDANFSPFSFVRWSGPLGPRLVSGWTSRRFSHLPSDEAQALHEYSYSLFRQRGSGEYALAYILAPGAFARSPLIRRIQRVGRQPLPKPITPAGASEPITKETGIPVVMMYGDRDWMDVAGGFAAEQKLKEEREKALKTANEEEKKRENGQARVVVVQKAGHHLYLEGWEEFNEIMRKEMEETSKESKKFA